ncbi:cyclic lactone autoinducer peptide [Anaerotignum sp. MB30-C6]|nr:cyclic lactone autoinducer peptide [Anaerotignum sp. MB30-C6]WMI80069.1 cyclic lactone autoinducer peptide [Anaerotignum sp. MB30-C6]
MKRMKEFLRSGSVKLSAQMLCATASMFAIMMCHGKLYEPKVPERLKR